MKSSRRRSPFAKLSAGIRNAFTELCQAHGLGELFGQSPWNFAVSFRFLEAIGLTEIDLRGLVCAGLVEIAEEIIPAEEGDRSFRPIGRLAISEHTCVVLTEGGIAFARELGLEKHGSLGGKAAFLHGAKGNLNLKPTWDAKLRQLRLGQHVVKVFTRKAPWQTLVLDCFQEENWPPFILDPLPPQHGQDPEAHLHSVLVGLNDRQDLPGIRFFRDGTGRICWQLRFF